MSGDRTTGVAPIRILVAEQQPIFRYGLRELLSTQPDFMVVGDASTIDETAKFVADFQPDVILLDLAMLRPSGFETLARLSGRRNARVIVLAASIPRSELTAAFRRGARGVISKDAPTTMLFKSIRAVFGGELWLGRQEIAAIIRTLGTSEDQQGRIGLTTREREVIQLVATGQSNRHVAHALSVSEDTIKRHLTNIFDKTGVSNRIELTLFAQQHDIVRSA